MANQLTEPKGDRMWINAMPIVHRMAQSMIALRRLISVMMVSDTCVLNSLNEQTAAASVPDRPRKPDALAIGLSIAPFSARKQLPDEQ
jgi:hypothetical protein